MAVKKSVVVSAESLKRRTESAIVAFKNLVDQLKSTNEEAAIAKESNTARIEMLQQENLAIDLLTSKNEKIVQNIEQIFQM